MHQKKVGNLHDAIPTHAGTMVIYGSNLANETETFQLADPVDPPQEYLLLQYLLTAAEGDIQSK